MLHLYNLCFIHSLTMFIIKINNVVIKEISNQNIAWSLYRATARDYVNKPAQITIEQDGQILHQKDAGRLLLDDCDYKNTNDVLLTLLKTLKIDIATAKQLIKSHLDVSTSRVNGWFYPADNRKFTKLYHDELIVIIEILLNYQKDNSKNYELGYTANNLKMMRKQLNLTQQKLAEILDVKTRQVQRWEYSEQDMPTEKWQLFLKYFEKNSCNTSLKDV